MAADPIGRSRSPRERAISGSDRRGRLGEDVSGQITVWDSDSGTLARVIRAEGEDLSCLAISPDGRNVAAAGRSRSIRLWDLETGQESLTLAGHSQHVNALAFAPGGRSLASCSHDGSVRLWRASPRP